MAANDVPCCEPMFWIYLCISAALVCFAGLMSGLTLGLMSLSLVDLEVLSKAGQPADRKHAEKILPVVKNQHLLLCTLLIYNAMAMEALPIFLDSILPAWCSILISVTLILAFGEIIPQAVCTRYGLSVGAKLSILVRLLMVVLFPIAYPISKVLDSVLGKNHSALLRRSELKTFVDLHGNEAGRGGELSHHETAIIGGALDLTQKTAKDAMTAMSQVFSLDIDTKLDRDVVELIMRKGHSRVPIYSGSPNNIIGLILVKNLIGFRPENETPVRNLTIRKIPRFYDHQPLYDILTQFEMGHSHMGVVVKSKLDVLRVPATAGHSVLYDLTEKLKSEPEQDERKVTNNQPSRKEFARKSPIMHWNQTKPRSPPLSGMMEQGQSTDWNIGNMNMSAADLDFISNSSEEVIGIITMEDVMEELLQDEIWDETDEYVDVHNKIQICMKPDKRPSPRCSPAARLTWRSPVASPLSPYHHTPPASHQRSPGPRSPASPYVISPQMRPTVLSSPRRSMLS